MKKSEAGFIVLPVLFLLILLAGLTQVMLYLVLDETFYQQEFLRYRQFLRISSGVMEAVARQTRLPRTGTYQLPQVELYPGKEAIKPQLTLDYQPHQQVQSITIHFPYVDGEWRLRKLYLEPPGGCNYPLYKEAAQIGYSSGGGPKLDKALFKTYSDRPFPRTAEDFTDGLKGYLYVGPGKDYYFPQGLKIAGTGVFYNQGNMTIGAGSTFTGRIWFLSQKNIYVGDNVRLPNAFLFAQDSIKVGRNVEVCGIMIAQNNIEMDEQSICRGNEHVVQTFITPSYIP